MTFEHKHNGGMSHERAIAKPAGVPEERIRGRAGQAQELDRQQQLTRDMLLRISGAIQVLEETLAQGASIESNGAHPPQVKEEVPL